MAYIGLLHYSCPPVVGGVEEIIHQQALLFHRYRHHVKILAGKGKQFTEIFEVEINPLLDSRHPQISQLQLNPGKNLAALHQYEKEILAYLHTSLHQYDILIAHNVLTMHYNLPLTRAIHRLASSSSIKVISWNHDSPYFYTNYPRRLDDPAWEILKKLNPKITYVVISEARAKEFKSLYHTRKKFIVIPNGIDPYRFFRLDVNTIRLIREERLFESDLLLVQPSRLHPRKNIELSIQVIKAFHDLGIKAKLLLTGVYDPHEKKASYYFRKLKDLSERLGVSEDIIFIAEHVFKSGQKLTPDRVTMRDLYLISDCLFLPSKQEGFGLPLLEAGMIKLPIACSDIPPFRSIAHNNVFYFSLTDSPQQIAQRLAEYLNNLNPHLMYNRVIRNYTWDYIYLKKIQPFLEAL
ncbi:MAG: glycosyl transferase family 1 [Candidatus Aminicenantes bacterium]|nr:glycosyltransferase family 4 protein [Candidatus Aminicenantes bacterium]RLE01588.1 MAG: glycosyl transferase family 1 [Candidatus Aminicenantes bacterium]RLE05035.1 MAG: glycosyl transferase family 1 [Candidatus Aminicenantes bacterium]HHF42843.1 glycosyltransferase [Candidatus Aminicenantes bacterium]